MDFRTAGILDANTPVAEGPRFDWLQTDTDAQEENADTMGAGIIRSRDGSRLEFCSGGLVRERRVALFFGSFEANDQNQI